MPDRKKTIWLLVYNLSVKPGVRSTITSIVPGVTGTCGSGTYRVAEYFDHLDSIGIGPNVAHLIGHGTVRRTVMGQEDRAPDADEMQEMKELFAIGMKGGAAGFSTGLFYAPGSYSETDEIIER